MLVASHTHHGPILELDTWPDAKHPYTQPSSIKAHWRCDPRRRQRKSDTRPEWGVASREAQLNHNRQSKRPDAPGDDRTLSVLRIETPDGRPIAHAVNFAAHPTVTDIKDLRFSADYVGRVRRSLVEQETGQPPVLVPTGSRRRSLSAAAPGIGVRTPARRVWPAPYSAKKVLDLAKTIRCETSKKPTLKVADGVTSHFKARLDVSNPIVKAALSKAPSFPTCTEVAFYEARNIATAFGRK